MYAVKHKAWYPHVVENEVPARLEFVNRNPRLYVMLNNQEDTENATTTSTEELGKLVVSEVCISPWIANVSYTRCTCFYLRMSVFTSPKISHSETTLIALKKRQLLSPIDINKSLNFLNLQSRELTACNSPFYYQGSEFYL